MSHFDHHRPEEYAANLRSFIRHVAVPHPKFGRNLAGVVGARGGRLVAQPPEFIAWLQELVNERAAFAEDSQATVEERIAIARDYLRPGLTDFRLARRLGITRAELEHWMAGRLRPAQLPVFAKGLGVPVRWLATGGLRYLPAHSHVGVRVGREAAKLREQLYGLTTAAFGQLGVERGIPQAQVAIERWVRETPEIAVVSRRAGGRWQFSETRSSLVFAPWQPLAKPKRVSPYPAETEAIISEELAAKPTVHQASVAIARRCSAIGLACPSHVGLHHRVMRELEWEEKWGVDLCAEIAKARRSIGC